MNRSWSVRSRAAIALPFCLSLWGLAAPVSAKTIVVTTTEDVVNLPFTADGLCGSGTIADLPNAGEISLREAVIAANNTPGKKTIKFALSSGATIKLTRGLALCGGHTTLNGDVDGNDTPDITLDGTAVLFPFDVLDIFSSHNTVKSLRVLAPGVSSVEGIAVAATPAVSTTLVDNTITHNIVTDGAIVVLTGFDYSTNGQPFNAATVKHTIVQGNTVSGPNEGIEAVIFGDHHEMTDLTIAGNTISGTTGVGILALGGILNPFDSNDDGATDNRLAVTIKDNLITGNTGNGIIVGAGQDNSSQNRVEAKIRGNTLENNAGLGIFTFGAIGAASSPSGESAGNRLDARIEQNTVENAFLFGIGVMGGVGSFAGLAGVADDNEVNAVVKDNTVTDTFGEGLHLTAGSAGEANDNEVDVTVRKNTVCGSTPPNADIHAIGGLLGNPFLPDNTGTGNVLEGEISKNTATTVVVEDGVTDNSAEVTQSKNVPCP